MAFQRSKRFVGSSDGDRGRSSVLDHRANDDTSIRVVLDKKHVDTGKDMRALHRQPQSERRATPSPFAFSLECPAVKLRELARDRKTESEPLVASRTAVVGLLEPIEGKRNELGIHSL